jgi:UDP-N-acetylglucosamine:LPS N-acetylglucosamine transferase
VQESAISNVPMICVPFKADQYYNAEGMASRGWATVLDIRQKDVNVLGHQLIAAIRLHIRNGFVFVPSRMATISS